MESINLGKNSLILLLCCFYFVYLYFLDDDNVFPPPKRARTVSRSSVASTPPPTIADFLNPLNQLVANTNNRPPVVLPPLPDMERLFGNQMTLFLRELDMEEKYTAQSFITNYVSEIIKKKVES